MTRSPLTTSSAASTQLARVGRLVFAVGLIAACAAVIQRPAVKTTTPAVPDNAEAFAHGVRLYVSGVNCEMNAEDATRLNALAHTPGLSVEVAFTGIASGDTSVLRQTRLDLGLLVSARIMRPRELEQYKSIGGRLPMAVVIKGRQLKTIVAGESLPRTLSIVEASLSPTAVP